MLRQQDVWIARHGRLIAAEVKEVGEAVTVGSHTLAALATVVGVAVLCEGAEVVLFIYGITVSGNDTVPSTATGGVVSVTLGGGVSAPDIFDAAAHLGPLPVLTAPAHSVWDTSNTLGNGSVPDTASRKLVDCNDRPCSNSQCTSPCSQRFSF